MLRLTLCLLAALATLMPGSAAHAATFTLDAADAGVYADTGQHTPGVESVQTGQLLSQTHRNFTLFDLAAVTGPILTAELRIELPEGSYLSADASETLSLYDVSTPAALLTAGPLVGGDAIYDDLGGGTLFGAGSVSAANDGTTLVITLNPDAVAAINALLALPPGARLFAIGGALSSIQPIANVQTVFGGTSETSKQLYLSTTAVPEPATAGLLSLGLLALRGLVKNREVGS